MPLSLHSEYLLGYLAGARSMDPRAAASITQAMCEDATQARALLRALALGMSDGRRNRALREGHEVRLHVLALLTRETSPGPMGRSRRSTMHPVADSDAPSDPSIAIDDFIRQAAELK
ncbi:MAG: hypothetical protein IPN17_35730 [Deltaproteobacteria bacterium]|nr:hypothetical protein [Deltaproteobacteria bacterium]MBK8697467.1 hypothetical protein [Deltaproteobacteria bacterium]MBP6830871.1 hypothetical protein [Deltaproteobacteria bacterium]